MLEHLSIGFATALGLETVAFCFLGALLGTLIGVLPGVGPLATISILLPVTFALDPVNSLIMLAGIYYGAQYGGSTTAILLNLPGESSSVVTTLDGYQLARQGRAGAALAIAAIASFFAGTIGTLAIFLLAVPLASVALQFGAAEYFLLLSLGLVAAVAISNGSLLKAVLMVVVGVLLGLVGTDINTGQQRMTFGIPDLTDGISFVPLAMGLFGVAEILRNLLGGPETRSVVTNRISGLVPRRDDLSAATGPTLRGTGLGLILGILPGAGATLASFAAYMLERRISRQPDRFGRGAIEGVAGPEAANNAAAQGSFIPMLTLGIPGSPVMAVMIGALIIHGIQPGPRMMTSQPELFWGLIASMWIGNLMLLVINLPLVGLWVQFLRVRYAYLFPAILILCALGVYSLERSIFDVGLIAAFGLLGLALWKLGCEPAPLVLGFVLGPAMEENFRRALLMSRGSALTFVSSPICIVLLACIVLLLLVSTLPKLRSTRDAVLE